MTEKFDNPEELEKKLAANDDDMDEIDNVDDNNDEEEDIPEDLDVDIEDVDTEEFLAKLNQDDDALASEKRVFQCPKCKKYYMNSKWIHDPITGITILKPELAFCNKCQKKVFEDDWIGRVVIHDKKLDEHKDMFIAIAEQIARTRENMYDFESLLAVYEEDGLLYINVNTTSLAREIGKRLREDYQGGIEYHWEDKNQYLTVKWFDEMKNSQQLKEKLKQKKDRYPGIYFFDDEE
ncbi:MAG: hypothetical protein Kow00108_24810 [Calditrichia bacterium]